MVYAKGGYAGPWSYTVEAGKILTDDLPLDSGRYGFAIHGPNGFLREFAGTATGAGASLDTAARYDAAANTLVLHLDNTGNTKLTVVTQPNAYSDEPPRTHVLAGGDAIDDAWNIAPSAHWYDVSVTMTEDADYRLRFAGHMETGMPSLSDPLLGQAST
jgi:phospholipase C